jgi:hypothetical protein
VARVENKAIQDQFGSTQDQLLLAPDHARGEVPRFDLDRRSISPGDALFHLVGGDAVPASLGHFSPSRRAVALWPHGVSGHGPAAL